MVLPTLGRRLPCHGPWGSQQRDAILQWSHPLSICYLEGPRPCVHVCTEGLGRNQMSNYPENLVLAISKQAIIRRHTIHPAVGFVLIIPSLSPPQRTAH